MFLNNAPPNSAIIARIRDGDPDALHTIVVQYRSMAVGWANSVLQDPYWAEDVVQDAFLQLPRKIAGLRHPDKFRAWLRTTVRRMALNQLRARRDIAVPDHRFSDNVSSGSGQAGAMDSPYDPQETVISAEAERLHMHALKTLPSRSQSLMQAYASDGSSPDELAERFGIATSNVYNIISRSRTKAVQERFRRHLNAYLTEKQQARSFGSVELSPPRWSSSYSLLASCMYEALKSAGASKWSLTEVMGLSGEAFRLNVTARCHWRGISTFDWSYAAYRTMEHIGWQGACYGRPGRAAISPEEQVDMLRAVQHSIDNGRPAVVWNMSMNEFGLLFGYDDGAATFLYSAAGRQPEAVPYSRLSVGSEQPPLFAAVLKRQTAGPASFRETLASIIRHAAGKEPAIPGFAFGLDGYRLWQDGIRSGLLDTQGHAYQTAILSERRQHAASYLRLLAERARNKETKLLLNESARCYDSVLASLLALYPSFPFGYGGSPGTGLNDGLAACLQEAMEAEQQAIRNLELVARKHP